MNKTHTPTKQKVRKPRKICLDKNYGTTAELSSCGELWIEEPKTRMLILLSNQEIKKLITWLQRQQKYANQKKGK